MRSKLLLASCIPFILSASALADEQRESLCKKLPEGNVCSRSTGTLYGDPPANSISKDGKSLVITVKDGSKKVWKNGEGESGARFEYFGFIKETRYFWVSGIYYEGQGHEWLSYEAGAVFKFSGFPKISPDGRHVLVQETPHGEIPTSIRIYSVNPQGVTELQSFDITYLQKGSGRITVGGPLWVNPAEIAIFSLNYDPATTASFIGPPVLARIKKQENIWVIHNEKRT